MSQRLYDPHPVGLRQALEEFRGKASLAFLEILKRPKGQGPGAGQSRKAEAPTYIKSCPQCPRTSGQLPVN